MPTKLLYISGNIADLSVTFIYREITDLRRLGLEIQTLSMNRPSRNKLSYEAQGLYESTTYLDQIAFLRKLSATFKAAFLHPFRVYQCCRLLIQATPVKPIKDYLRLGYHLIEACYVFSTWSKDRPDHIHSHFLHGPTSIAMFLAELMQVPFSFTSHGSLIWFDPIGLSTKLERCKFHVTISHFNKAHLLLTYGKHLASKVHVVRCGIVLPESTRRSYALRSGPSITILGVARLFESKGFHVLLRALRILIETGEDFQCIIVGEGPERARLERMIKDWKLQATVTLAGAQPHERIPEFLERADIFALPCVVAENGKRDGLPVSLMEAMAHGVPVISTNIVGLPELIESGINGILVPPDDPTALAAAILELTRSEALRRDLGVAGAQKVGQEFNATRSAERLKVLFQS